MFKFKMLRKVLVAVFFYSLIIELNLNLCIALSIDLSASGQIEPGNARGRVSIEATESDRDSSGLSDSAEPTNRSLSSGRAPEPASSQTVQQQESITKMYDSQLARTTIPLVQVLESNGRHNYFGRIHVGKERQVFYVLFDLTSSQFWLPSSECKSLHCKTRQAYNRTRSPSYKPDGRRIEVGHDRDLSYNGQVIRERVELAGSVAEDLEIVEVAELAGNILDLMPVDGFMGFGFKELNSRASNQSSHLMSAVERLWSQGLLKEPIFSLDLKADVEQFFYSNDNGELRLGELSSYYTAAELAYAPVSHADFWEFHLEGVALRSIYELERGCESACPAILDTRHAFIGGHFNDVDRINKAMGAYPVGGGIYRLGTCDLGVLPQLVFQIGGAEFALDPEEYVDVHRIRGEPHACFSALVVVEAKDYPYWILGEYFLKRHYIVFDYGKKRIGFARSKRMAQKVGHDSQKRVRGII